MSTALHIWTQILSALQLELIRLEGAPVTVWSIIEFVGLTFLLFVFAPKLNAALLKRMLSKVKITMDLRKHVVRISRAVLLLAGLACILHLIGLDGWVFLQMRRLYLLIQGVMDLQLFKLGATRITLLTLIYLLIVSYLLVRGSSEVHHLVSTRILAKTRMDAGARQTIASAARYGLMFLGFIVLLQTAGIDISALTVVLGALGIGISFGLQTITNNFISGLIILFERPIKIGDRIQVGSVVGEVVDISLRATTVVTNEGIAIVVPNSQFVTSNVINWTHTGRTVGLKFPISVPARGQPAKLQKLLVEAVKAHPGVLNSPPPTALIEELSQDSLKFSIRFWTGDFLAAPERLKSELIMLICERLAKSGIHLINAPQEEEGEVLKAAS